MNLGIKRYGSVMKKYRSSMKISIFDKIIILLTIICFCATLTFSCISYHESQKNYIKAIENNLIEFSENTKIVIDKYIDKNLKILNYIAGFEEIYKMSWEEQYEFLLSKTKNLDFTHYIIMDMLGQGYYTNTGEIKNQSTEQFYEDVIFNDKFITDPFLEVNEKRSIVTLSVSIYDEQNKKIGALCGVVDLNNINKLFEHKVIGKEGYCFLINKEGYYVSHTDMDYVFKRKNIFNDSINNENNNIEFLKNAININEPLIGNIKLNNIVYYTSIYPIENTQWYVISLFPKSEVLKNLNKFVIFQIMIVIFGILLLILIRRLICSIIENRNMACTDSLTNLNNHFSYKLVMKKLERKYNKNITIICLDLNDFKLINDTYGHKIGDEALCIFAGILLDVFKNKEFIARNGGDEFIVISLENNYENIKYKLNEVEILISEYNKHSKYKLGTSYGYSTRIKGDKLPLDKIQEEADIYMYRHKSNKSSKNNTSNKITS